MKSDAEKLGNRGYITDVDIINYNDLNKNELLKLLKAQEPHKRTIAVKLLSNKYELDKELIDIFCDMLSKEKKLYTKIELCNALAVGDISAAKAMIKYLGRIGNNQYKELPDKKFNKSSYPLPRDIIARTLARMNIYILPELIKVLKGDDIIAIREVIDSIGFICFYNLVSFSQGISNELIICLSDYGHDVIIRWKIVRALESFNSKDAIDILMKIAENDSEEIIRVEAARSLEIIESRSK